MNTEFKSMVRLMRSKDPTNRDLGFELAKGVFPEFLKWFEERVANVLTFCQSNSEWAIRLRNDILVNGRLYRNFPKKMPFSFRYKGKGFWHYIVRSIMEMKYMEYQNLFPCICGKGGFCSQTNVNPIKPCEDDLPF